MKNSQENNQEIVVVGLGGHAASIANIASDLNIAVSAYFCNSDPSNLTCKGVPVYSEFHQINHNLRNVIVAIGDNFARQQFYQSVPKENKFEFPSLIHPRAIVSKSARIGPGTVVMPGAVIGPNVSIGEFCVVNTGACIDHDCDMQDFSSLAPGVVLGGRVIIGVRSAIGMGASVEHKVTIGDDVVVGGQSYVNKNLSDRIVAYGVPVKKIRDRTPGDNYL